MFIDNRRHARAYTLLEIVIVIAIIGIVSAIAIPYFGPTDDQKAASAARRNHRRFALRPKRGDCHRQDALHRI